MSRETTVIFLSCLCSIPIAGADRLIRVDGDALIEAKPDYAIVRLNLEARDRLLKRARATHQLDVSSVMQIALKYRIAADDIAEDFPEIETRGDGFLLRRTIQLTVRDLRSYDAMLFDLYDGAAVTVETVEFRVNDLRKLRDQARDMAIRAAEEKAQLMAGAMKRRVGKVMDVRVETGGGTLVRRRGQSVSYMANVAQNVAMSAGDASPSNGAELFRVPVTARVNVEYEILEQN